MSKDIIVLTPNGRRQKIHCTPDTSMLQVLEDVCEKQGFQPTEYDLKHHNHILDLTTTIRFSNLPNKATIEMVGVERKREEKNVTIGLMLEDGERLTADFPPNTTLYELITSLAPTELSSLSNPAIMYMRQEVAGVLALKDKTLRQLGLIGGRAILRLLNKAEEALQANVSAIYRRALPLPEKEEDSKHIQATTTVGDIAVPGPSDVHKNSFLQSLNPLQLLRNERDTSPTNAKEDVEESQQKQSKVCVDNVKPTVSNVSSDSSLASRENFERRLRIEEEVTFLGTQKAIAFIPEDDDEIDDLPDDFYELTIEEVRKLYSDLQQSRIELENTPLVTAGKREDSRLQMSQQKLNEYRNAVVRVQFPDHIILQGIFSPTNTIQDIIDFIKVHLKHPEKPFHVFTTPLKETLNPKMTLVEAKFVPCVHMHFKWLQETVEPPYLKDDVYLKKTSSDAASILASKYRAPNRRKLEDTPQSSQQPGTSKSKNSKVPKWFKK